MAVSATWTCDRCGIVGPGKFNTTKNHSLPEGWSQISDPRVSRPQGYTNIEVCAECKEIIINVCIMADQQSEELIARAFRIEGDRTEREKERQKL